MNVFPYDSKIDFLRLRSLALTLTLVLLVGAIALLATRGLNFALDFTGGTVAEFEFEKPVDLDAVRKTDGVPLATPANWLPGQDVIVALALDDAAAEAKYGALEKPLPYLRFARDPA